jgi:Nucleotide-diphospho-sugar transferase
MSSDAKQLDEHANSCLLRSGYDGRYKFGILPVSTFCSGHTFFTQRMHEKLKLQPYVVHATFQFSGTPGKRHRMREFMLWHVSAVCFFVANRVTAALHC